MFRLQVCLVLLSSIAPIALNAQDDVADIKSKKITLDKEGPQEYFLIQPTTTKTPKQGSGLLIIMPGGDGGEAFHPFIKRIRKHAVPVDFFVAQPISIKWTAEQKIVWPIEKLKVDKQKFSTERFVRNIIQDVKKNHKLNPKKIFCMGWSSSGPAVYALALQKNSPISGSYIAMSVYKPNQLPPLANAKGKSIYIEHSPQDRICPYFMAKKGFSDMEKNGARAKLVEYEGGHGWRGGVYARIKNAISWMDQAGAVLETENLIQNSDLANGKDRPEHWQQGPAVGGVTYKWIKSKDMKSPSFLKMTKTVNRYFPIAAWTQKLTFDGKHKKIQLAAKVKAVSAEKAILDVIFFDENGKHLGHKWAAYIGRRGKGDLAVTHDWKKYSGIADIPEGTKTIMISLQCYGPGEVSFSDVQAKYVKE